MYSILLSKIEALELMKKDYNNILKSDSNVAILPWTFPTELDAEKLENDFFKKGGDRYNRYIEQLKRFNINESNIKICNCYSQDNVELSNIIDNSDIILLPGGNPEMLMNKILHKTELLYKLKHFNGIIIGESAGCLVQFERYFITKENNFYDYFAFYDGIGIINDSFLVDVHSLNSNDYLSTLKWVSDKENKKIYAIFDDGLLIYDRKSKKISELGNVKLIN